MVSALLPFVQGAPKGALVSQPSLALSPPLPFLHSLALFQEILYALQPSALGSLSLALSEALSPLGRLCLGRIERVCSKKLPRLYIARKH